MLDSGSIETALLNRKCRFPRVYIDGGNAFFGQHWDWAFSWKVLFSPRICQRGKCFILAILRLSFQEKVLFTSRSRWRGKALFGQCLDWALCSRRKFTSFMGIIHVVYLDNIDTELHGEKVLCSTRFDESSRICFKSGNSARFLVPVSVWISWQLVCMLLCILHSALISPVPSPSCVRTNTTPNTHLFHCQQYEENTPQNQNSHHIGDWKPRPSQGDDTAGRTTENRILNLNGTNLNKEQLVIARPHATQ